MSDYKPYLALALVVFSIGIIFLSPSQTGLLLSVGGGEGGSGDTTKPSVSISAPASATTSTYVSFSATASDNSRVNYIYIYVDNSLKKTCSINAASGSCAFATKLSAGSHSYYAKAVDSSSNQGIASAKSISITTAVSTVPVTVTKSDWAVNPWVPTTNSIPLDFGQDYTNVGQITFKGIPGGELCGAAVKLDVYNSAGSVTSDTTGKVDAHQTASKTISLNAGSKVSKVVGSTTPGGAFNACAHLDYLEATLIVSDDKNGPTISSNVNSEKEEIASSGGFGASQLVKVTFDVTANDPSKVSSIIIKIGSVEKKKCTFSYPSTTASCTYVMIKAEIINYADSGTTQTVTIESTDVLGNKNIYTDTIKLTRFGSCIGFGC